MNIETTIAVSNLGHCRMTCDNEGYTMLHKETKMEYYPNGQFLPHYWYDFCVLKEDNTKWRVYPSLEGLTGEWTGDFEPKVNDIVHGNVCNDLVRCHVLGYVEHCDYIGVLVKVVERNTKFEKQNKGLPITVLFGREIKHL